MPFDATTAPLDAEARARAYAARLDVLLTDLNASDALEDALLAVGNLLGGLGCKGFAHDLEMHLARVEADLLGEADPWDYSSLGPNDPDGIFSARLSDLIDQSRADDCEDWLASARALLEAA